MPILKTQAVEMKDATVSFVSLVERGANRIPFKIVKQEITMGAFKGLDLGHIFSRKSVKPEVAVVGIVTMKGENFESIKKQIEAAGFSVSDIVESEDGSMVFKQEGWDGEGTILRMNEHVAMVTKGFSPYNMEFSPNGEASFGDMCTAQGFYPGVNTIMQVMSDSVITAVSAAKSPSEARDMVSKMFDESKAYTLSFMGSLPEKAFKLESIEPEVVATEKDGGEEVIKAAMTAAEKSHLATLAGADKMAFLRMTSADRTKAMAANAAENAAGTKKPAKKEDITATKTDVGAGSGDASTETTTPSEAVTTEKSEPKSLTEAEVSSIVSSQVAQSTDELTQKMGEMMATFSDSLKTSMSSIEGSVAVLVGRVEQAEIVSKKAQEAVTGVVVGSEGAGDKAVTKKTETRVGGEIDTGMMGRNRNRR